MGQEGERAHWRDLVPPSQETFVHGIEVFQDYLVVSVRSDGLRKLRLQPWASGTPSFITADEPAYATFLSSQSGDGYGPATLYVYLAHHPGHRL